MPASHTVTPEPVTNSGRGWGEESAEAGDGGQESGEEHLIGSSSGHLPSPHTGSVDCSWEFGRGFWLEEEEEACWNGVFRRLLPPPLFPLASWPPKCSLNITLCAWWLPCLSLELWFPNVWLQHCSGPVCQLLEACSSARCCGSALLERAEGEQHRIQEVELEGEPQGSCCLSIFCSRHAPGDFPRSWGGLSF